MNLNETTTTAVIFVSVLLVGLLLGTIAAVQRGEVVWGGEEEVVETAPAPINFGNRPTFSSRAQPKLKSDKDVEVTEEPVAPPIKVPTLDALGWALSLIGIVWLLIEAFSQGVIWGIAVLFGNLLGGIVFLFAYPRRAWRPLSVQCLGYAALIWAAIAV